jgi:hypothetical protein
MTIFSSSLKNGVIYFVTGLFAALIIGGSSFRRCYIQNRRSQ